MSEKWEHEGTNYSLGDALLDAASGGLWSAMGSNECVREKDTDELREVFRAGYQTTGEAIANGQFTDTDDDDCDDDDDC